MNTDRIHSEPLSDVARDGITYKRKVLTATENAAGVKTPIKKQRSSTGVYAFVEYYRRVNVADSPSNLDADLYYTYQNGILEELNGDVWKLFATIRFKVEARSDMRVSRTNFMRVATHDKNGDPNHNFNDESKTINEGFLMKKLSNGLVDANGIVDGDLDENNNQNPAVNISALSWYTPGQIYHRELITLYTILGQDQPGGLLQSESFDKHILSPDQVPIKDVVWAVPQVME